MQEVIPWDAPTGANDGWSGNLREIVRRWMSLQDLGDRALYNASCSQPVKLATWPEARQGLGGDQLSELGERLDLTEPDYVDFSFELTFGRTIPDYGWREGPWRGRATRRAILLVHGPMASDMKLSDAFTAAAAIIRMRAADLVIAAEGEIMEPVVVDSTSLM